MFVLVACKPPSVPHDLAGCDEARTFMKTVIKAKLYLVTTSAPSMGLKPSSVTLASQPHRSRSWSWDCRSLPKTVLRSRSGHQQPPACLQWRLGRNPHGAGSWMPPVREETPEASLPKPWHHVPQLCPQSEWRRRARQCVHVLGRGAWWEF